MANNIILIREGFHLKKKIKFSFLLFFFGPPNVILEKYDKYLDFETEF